MRAIIVLGPESAGNRYTTRLLIAGGCRGHGSTDQPLVDIPRTWQINPPTPGPIPLAFLRSYPYGDESDNWPRLDEIVQRLCDAGYTDIEAVACLRNQNAIAQSQVRHGHAATISEAESAIETAYRLIIESLIELGVRWTFAAYDALGDESYRKWLLRTMRLNPDATTEPFRTIHEQPK